MQALEHIDNALDLAQGRTFELFEQAQLIQELQQAREKLEIAFRLERDVVGTTAEKVGN